MPDLEVEGMLIEQAVEDRAVMAEMSTANRERVIWYLDQAKEEVQNGYNPRVASNYLNMAQFLIDDDAGWVDDELPF